MSNRDSPASSVLPPHTTQTAAGISTPPLQPRPSFTSQSSSISTSDQVSTTTTTTTTSTISTSTTLHQTHNPKIYYAKAKYDFPAQNSDELPFEEEDVICVTQTESRNEWLFGENNGVWGWFPAAYVRAMTEDEIVAEGLGAGTSGTHSHTHSNSASVSGTGHVGGYSSVGTVDEQDEEGVFSDNETGGDLVHDRDHSVDVTTSNGTLSSTTQLTSGSQHQQPTKAGWFAKYKKKKPGLGGTGTDDVSSSTTTSGTGTPTKTMSRADSVSSSDHPGSVDLGEPQQQRSRMGSSSISTPSKQTIKLASNVSSKLKPSGKTVVSIVGAPAETKPRWVDFAGGADVVEKLNLSKHERQRQEVIFEIVTTERDYVEDLEIVSEVYIKQLKKNKLLRPKDVSVIFSNIEALFNVNNVLAKRLEERRAEAENGVVEQIGDIFCGVSDYLKMYTMYCSNHPYAVMKLQTVRQSKAVARFLDQCAALPESRNLNLANFLLKPVQRICKYPLLLREMIKHTEQTHPDYENLNKALLKIETVVAMVNEGARQAESVQKMLEIQGRLTQKINIIAPTRLLQKYGPLDLLQPTGERKKREIYLFNDMLLMAKPQGTDGEKLKLITMVPFDMILVNSPADDPIKELYLIEIVHVNQAKFLLCADSERSKQAWVKAFMEATNAWIGSKASRGGGGAGEIEARVIMSDEGGKEVDERESESEKAEGGEQRKGEVSVGGDGKNGGAGEEKDLSEQQESGRSSVERGEVDAKNGEQEIGSNVRVSVASVRSVAASSSPKRAAPPPLPIHSVSPKVIPVDRNSVTQQRLSIHQSHEQLSSSSETVVSSSITTLSTSTSTHNISTTNNSISPSASSNVLANSNAQSPYRSRSVRVPKHTTSRIATNHFIVQDISRASGSPTTTVSHNALAGSSTSESTVKTSTDSTTAEQSTTKSLSALEDSHHSATSTTPATIPHRSPQYPRNVHTSRCTTSPLPSHTPGTSSSYNSLTATQQQQSPSSSHIPTPTPFDQLRKAPAISPLVKELQEQLKVKTAGDASPSTGSPVPLTRPRGQSIATASSVFKVEEKEGGSAGHDGESKDRTFVGTPGVVQTRSPAPLKPVPIAAAGKEKEMSSVETIAEDRPSEDPRAYKSFNKPIKRVMVAEVLKQSGQKQGSKDYIYSIRVFYVGPAAVETTYSIIYHTFEDFVDFHLQLIGHFPEEAGLQLRPSLPNQTGDNAPQRIIPELPGQMMFVSEAVAKARIGLLQEYAKAVIALPQKISRSPVVMQFFRQDGKKAGALVKGMKVPPSRSGSFLTSAKEISV
ncbi:Myosin 10A, isoform D [Blyttiomyces sp. JEL0837]|nr:Myosin 10A, isoform D [Blyttiomyces sp. JEL0837]